MKFIHKPTFSIYFCIQLILLQFCSTYCEVGNCASLRHLQQFNSGDERSDSDASGSGSGSDSEGGSSRMPNKIGITSSSNNAHDTNSLLNAHLHDSFSHDPFVYNWFRTHPKYIMEILIRNLFRDSMSDEQLLNAILQGMITQPAPGFNPNRLPKEIDDDQIFGHGPLGHLAAAAAGENQEEKESENDETKERDFGSIVNKCSNARRAGHRVKNSTVESLEDTTTAAEEGEESSEDSEYDEDDDDDESIEDDENDIAPDGCYFYTGDTTYRNYLVCSDLDITEVPHHIPTDLDVFEMNVTSVECIRPYAFENVSITLLRLSRNKIQGVAREAFGGVVGLKHLSMNHNYLQLPIWFTSPFGLEEVELIEMEANKINMDTLSGIGNGQYYEQLRVDNSIDSDGPFLSKLRYLSVSNNPIGFLPSFFFNRFAGTTWLLLTIYLAKCDLHHIDPDAFAPFRSIYILDLSENPDLRHNINDAAIAISKAKVQKLNLAHNSLANIPTEALIIMEGSLTGLDLRGNSFIRLQDDTFPHMSKLTALNLDQCRLSEISKRAFENLVKLDTLSLKGNALLSIPAALAPLINLNTLVMTENKNDMQNQFIVGSKVFSTLTQLKSLFMNDLRLISLNSTTFEGLVKLKLLHITNCQLQTLEDGIFLETPSLTFLDVSDNNRLSGINANTFAGLENLDSLYMRSCSLTFPTTARQDQDRNITSHYRKLEPGRENEDPELNGPEERRRIVDNATVDFVTIGQVLQKALDTSESESGEDDEDGDNEEYRLRRQPFRYLKRLKYLFLNNNNIGKLYPELFHTMPYLHELDLSKNSIQTWTGRVFTNNTVLSELHLSSNHLWTTSDAMLEDFEDVYTNIDLSDNPYSCDLGICNLKSAVENKSFYLHEWHTASSRYQCYKTPNVRVLINTLNTAFCENLDTDPTTNPGPESSTSTTTTPASTTTSTSTTSTTTTTTTTSTTTEKVDHEDDSETTVIPVPTKPSDRTPRGESPDGGGIPSSFSVTTLLIVGICLIVLTTGAVVFYKKRLHLKYFWFDFKLNLVKGRKGRGESKLIRSDSNLSSSDKNGGSEFDFDVFISYSHHDSGFIQEYIVPVLEGKGKFLMNEKTASVVIPEVFNPVLKEQQQQQRRSSITSIKSNAEVQQQQQSHEQRFKICLHERDFEVGTSITENIVDSVDRSRKVIIVVSRNYLESQWCLFEMNLAYHRLVEVRRKSFVLILLEEVPGELRTKVLNYLMKSTTYLQWPGEKANEHEKKIFWTRLRHSLKTTV